MNWQFHCSCRNTSDMYQSCYKRFAGMQCIRVTSLKNVTLQTRRDDDDFNFADRNGFGRLAVQLTGSVIINNNNFLFPFNSLLQSVNRVLLKRTRKHSLTGASRTRSQGIHPPHIGILHVSGPISKLIFKSAVLWSPTIYFNSLVVTVGGLPVPIKMRSFTQYISELPYLPP